MSASWPLKTLGEVSEIIMGQAPPGADCNKEGRGTPFVKVAHFTNSRPEISEWTTNPKKMARESDVLICVVGNCGQLNLGTDCAIGRSVAAIRPNESSITQKFLFYYLARLLPLFESISRGTAQKVLRKNQLNNIEIPLPSLPEQQRIVNKLQEVYQITNQRLQSISHIEVNSADLLQSFLGDYISKNGKDWNHLGLGEVCEVLDRLRKPISKKDRNAGEFPYYGATGVVDYVDDFIFDERLVLVGEDGAKWGPGDNTSFIAEGSIG